MRMAVISLGSVSSQMTIKAMKKYCHDVDDINLKDVEVTITSKGNGVLYKGESLEGYDCILAKGSFRYAPLLRAITLVSNKNAYMPLVPSAFTIGHDKILTHLALQKHGIPMPETYLSATSDSAKKILEKINYPIIMKFPHGTQGKGVMFAESYAAASSMLDALSALNQPFLIQEYVETDGQDVRAIVVGDKVVASYMRESADGEKRANIHAGGHGKAYEIDAHTKKIAVKAAQAVGADICGVDILESIKGPVVIEINLSPGLQGVTAATKIDVADKIAKFLYEKTKKFKDSTKKKATKDIMQEISSNGLGKEIITALDFRGERILLPEFVTKETKFKESDELVLTIKKGKISIEKFSINK